MAVFVTKPDKYTKCICCDSDQHDTHEVQFFQDIGMKTCITLCRTCVHQMVNIMTQDIVNKLGVKYVKRTM